MSPHWNSKGSTPSEIIIAMLGQALEIVPHLVVLAGVGLAFNYVIVRIGRPIGVQVTQVLSPPTTTTTSFLPAAPTDDNMAQSAAFTVDTNSRGAYVVLLWLIFLGNFMKFVPDIMDSKEYGGPGSKDRMVLWRLEVFLFGCALEALLVMGILAGILFGLKRAAAIRSPGVDNWSADDVRGKNSGQHLR